MDMVSPHGLTGRRGRAGRPGAPRPGTPEPPCKGGTGLDRYCCYGTL